MGMPILMDVPQHGHSNAFDGGVLKTAACTAYKNSGTQAFLPLTGDVLTLDAEDYDPLNMHSNTVNNSRFTMPFGYNYAVVSLNISYSLQVPDDPGYFQVFIWKNRLDGGAVIPRSGCFFRTSSTIGAMSGVFATRPLPIITGDYIEVVITNVNSGGINLTVNPTNTYVTVELYR